MIYLCFININLILINILTIVNILNVSINTHIQPYSDTILCAHAVCMCVFMRNDVRVNVGVFLKMPVRNALVFFEDTRA